MYAYSAGDQFNIRQHLAKIILSFSKKNGAKQFAGFPTLQDSPPDLLMRLVVEVLRFKESEFSTSAGEKDRADGGQLSCLSLMRRMPDRRH